MGFDLKLNLTYPIYTGDYFAYDVVDQDDNVEGATIPGLLAGILIPHLICTVFIGLRVVSRLACLRQWFLDDTLIVAAWTWSTGVCVVYSLAAEVPAIRDANITAESPVAPYLLRTYLGLIFYQLCLCLTKLSILTFYMRMLSSRASLSWLSFSTTVFVVAYGIPLLFMSIFQCYPIEGQVFGHPMKCLGFSELLIASACLHTVTDAWLIILIVPVISRLDLPLRQKVALSVVLSLSIFVIAASLIRLQLSLHRDFRPTFGVQGPNTMAFFVMTVLECDIALICASAPTLRPLISRLWPRVMHEPVVEENYTTSFNLTTVVSYHGYPWTEPNTPMRSRTGSAANTPMRSRAGSRAGSLANMRVPLPRPPMPALTYAHRTPTSSSLKSMMSRLPRTRGATESEMRPMLDNESDDVDWRRNSVGFEGYEDQYLGYGEKRSKFKGAPIKTVGTTRQWSNSQESFMAATDPASPRTLNSFSGGEDKGKQRN
ncbi:hypothetical protein F5Y15DRAFT_98152 [Xylariaceae sp. FL0016]|nr:hypothetical protein F5Y15DRAFT_98152 [Xylariaceae sp. FL0016]